MMSRYVRCSSSKASFCSRLPSAALTDLRANASKFVTMLLIFIPVSSPMVESSLFKRTEFSHASKSLYARYVTAVVTAVIPAIFKILRPMLLSPAPNFVAVVALCRSAFAATMSASALSNAARAASISACVPIFFAAVRAILASLRFFIAVNTAALYNASPFCTALLTNITEDMIPPTVAIVFATASQLRIKVVRISMRRFMPLFTPSVFPISSYITDAASPSFAHIPYSVFPCFSCML